MEQPLEQQEKKLCSDAMKRAMMKYRANNLERYSEIQRNYYNGNKDDPEWRAKFNARCRENNRKYREKLREANPPSRGRGRPKKSIQIGENI